ncbi:MAG: YceD family protein [Sphingomonadaceae bacterium]
MAAPEFSHPIAIDRLSSAPRLHRLVADSTQRAALARRFDLLSIGRLEAELDVRRAGAGAIAQGPLRAEVVQRCVVSGEPVAASLDIPLDLRFQPETDMRDEIELSPEALDLLPVEDGMIDLGEAVAQSLALALDPWPRADAGSLEAARVHLMTEAEAEAASAALKAKASPFAVLKGRET